MSFFQRVQSLLRTLRHRVALVYLLVGLLMLGMVGRVFAISVGQHTKYDARAERNSTNTVILPAERGRIFGSDGNVMAQTAFSGSAAYMNTRVLRHMDQDELQLLVKRMAEALHKDPDQLRTRMLSRLGNAGLPMDLRLDDDEARMVMEYKERGLLPGLELRRRVERLYPLERGAAQLLGFTGMEGEGGSGIELMLDPYLRGKDGEVSWRVDARRRGVSRDEEARVDPVDGADVHLTIDTTIQAFAEQALNTMAEEWKPESACAIVMESKTGRILALANYPGFDPNLYNEATPEQLKNRSFTDAWEPGSIFKPLIYAIAIERGIITPDTPLPYPPADRFDHAIAYVGSRRIVDDHVVPDEFRVDASGRPNPAGGYIPAWAALMKSSNIAANYVIQSIYAGKTPGVNRFEVETVQPYDGAGPVDAALRTFGFGAYSGIDVGAADASHTRGESRGSLPFPSEWKRPANAIRNVLPSLAQGYQTKVTTIQMLSCFNAIANNGERVLPWVIERVTARDGSMLMQGAVRSAGNSGFSPQTARTMREVLEKVVDDGTATSARLERYTIAGKTGTAKIAGPNGYEDRAYTCSFIGFAPVADPRLTAIVVARRPSQHAKNRWGTPMPYYGGTVAAPALARIMEQSLPYLGVPSDIPAGEGPNGTRK